LWAIAGINTSLEKRSLSEISKKKAEPLTLDLVLGYKGEDFNPREGKICR